MQAFHIIFAFIPTNISFVFTGADSVQSAVAVRDCRTPRSRRWQATGAYPSWQGNCRNTAYSHHDCSVDPCCGHCCCCHRHVLCLIMCIFTSLNVVLAHLCSSPSCRGAQFKVKKQARITLYQHKSCQLRQRRLQLTKQR